VGEIDPVPRLHNILVANRGEIAVRIIKAARALGYRTTAVYSEADAHAPHVALADAAVLLGPAAVGASYLNIERVIDAARRAGADAVHPGYGLLSENANFARACSDAGLVFVGPSAASIELMGDKRRARIAVQEAGVPCVPGYDGEAQDDAALMREAARIGFPIMVKAAAGGGGRGMRRANDATELAEALTRARSESKKAFGDDRLILERAIDGGRHIEVQVLADSHGHVLHLGERDCSLQRRFQKVIEEAPSPAVDDALRAQMGELAVRAAQRANYVGAGTVELLLDAERRFYFLEMNTRLQVEHPVTEMVTGIDIVEWQFRIAEGQPLTFAQSDVKLRGHSIEARLYAEDPNQGFVPSTGRLLQLEWPMREGLRVDHGVAPGSVISSHYDPMIAKVVAHGATREEARRCLVSALEATRVLGLRTNREFLCTLLKHERFVQGEATTDFIDRHFVRDAGKRDAGVGSSALAAAAMAFTQRDLREANHPTALLPFSTCVGVAWPLSLDLGDRRVSVTVTPERDAQWLVRVEGASHTIHLLDSDARGFSLRIDGINNRFDHGFDAETGALWMHAAGSDLCVRDLTYLAPDSTAVSGSGRALAPMDGGVVDVLVAVGDPVTVGQTLVVVEAMKLELRVRADVDGVVSALHVARGDQVKARKLLVEVEATSDATH